jgi:GNAT superfamily N-acetyltransferase
MSGRWRIFLWGFGVSCVGSLPPGILNTGVAALVGNGGVVAAVEFGLGAVLVEVVLVRLALAGMASMKGAARWVYLGCGAVLCLVAFGVKGWGVSRLPFFTGAALSLINPLHLPFWLGWIAALRRRKILGDKDGGVFPLAVGAGTAVAFLVYGFAGGLFVGWLGMFRGMLNWVVVGCLAVAGLGQMRTVFPGRRRRLVRLLPGEPPPVSLLLMADETAEAIERYIHQCEVYVAVQGKSEVGVCALYRNSAEAVEIKNMAVIESLRGKGLGSWMLEEIRRIADRDGYTRIIVGTATVGRQLDFYLRNGFSLLDIRKNFFLENYPEPIVEDGQVLCDMVVLERSVR